MLNNEDSVFATDLFAPLIEAGARSVGRAYGEDERSDIAIRQIAEHGRAMTMLVADGVLPSNEGRGYVLRLSLIHILDLPNFTLVGATTRTGLVAAPLRDRFGFVGQLDLYDVAELCAIVVRSSRLLGVELSPDAAKEIALRSRGTPRIVNRLLRRVRDVAQLAGKSSIDQRTAEEALALFGVDAFGLDKLDRRLLHLLCVQFAGQPVGLVTLAHACGEEPTTLEEAYEPFLIREGLLLRTPRGRVATQRAYAHLGVTPPGGGLL